MRYIILTIIVCLAILFKFLELSSITKITNKNIDFISDIYKLCDKKYKTKLERLIDWHRKYKLPFLVERSEKVDIKTGNKNNLRFAVFIDMDCFMGENQNKWLEFSDIIGIPREIEVRCLSKMLKYNDVDIIWGLDPLEKVEKIYLEYPYLGKIESYIIRGLDVIDRYKYIKMKSNNNKFLFMYKRIASNNKSDSYHMVLKNPIEFNKGTAYIISYNYVKNTYTTYYRFD